MMLHMNTAVANAVEPLRANAVARAEIFAQSIIDRTLAELAANDWDANKIAAYPSSHMSPADYQKAKSKYALVRSLTMYVKSSRRHTEPDARLRSPENEARFIDIARKSAAFEFDAYVAKLSHKVGDTVQASIDGRTLWDGSTLSVVKADGTVERWLTNQILNVSKLGKVFNQWPTRKAK